MGNLYQKVFTGEIPPILIKSNTPANKQYTQVLTAVEPETTTYKELSILKWRDIAKLHLPANASMNSAEFEFKLEYLEIDFVIPDIKVVPSDALPRYSPADTDAETLAKTADLRNKYDRRTGHAIEIQLLRHYDPNYKLNNSPIDTYNTNTNLDSDLEYPVNELLYNNRIPGFRDLMPYLIKNGNLIFSSIQHELMLRVIPNLGNRDRILVVGGYTGSVTYEEISPRYEIQATISRPQTIGISPTKILNFNPSRFSFYLSNNADQNIYFSFSSGSPNFNLKLTLKPKKTLIYEHGELFIDGTKQDFRIDNRIKMGCPLWAWASIEDCQISIEELSYVEVE